MCRTAPRCVSYNRRKGCARSCDGGFLVTGLAFLQQVGTERGVSPNHRDGDGLEYLVRRLGGEQDHCPAAIPASSRSTG